MLFCMHWSEWVSLITMVLVVTVLGASQKGRRKPPDLPGWTNIQA